LTARLSNLKSDGSQADVRTIVSGLAVIGDPEEGEFLGVSGISDLWQRHKFRPLRIMAVDPQQTGDPAFGNLLRVNYRNQVEPW